MQQARMGLQAAAADPGAWSMAVAAMELGTRQLGDGSHYCRGSCHGLI